MTYKTGKCKYCLGTPEQHVTENPCKTFIDSGEARLMECAEELFEAAGEVAFLHYCQQEGSLSLGVLSSGVWLNAIGKLHGVIKKITE